LKQINPRTLESVMIRRSDTAQRNLQDVTDGAWLPVW